MTQHIAPTPERLTSDLVAEISSGHHEQPRISLYQQTHRHHPENRQDPIRLEHGRASFVVPKASMPTASGAAAICRY